MLFAISGLGVFGVIVVLIVLGVVAGVVMGKGY